MKISKLMGKGCKETKENVIYLTDEELDDLYDAITIYSIKGNAKISVLHMKDIIKYFMKKYETE